MILPDKDEDKTEGEASDEDEESRPSPELQGAVIECLGRSWPDNPETQDRFTLEFVKLLSALFEATTRANQLSIVTCLRRVMAKQRSHSPVLPEVGKLLAAALVVPKHSQLRSAGLEVLADLAVLARLSRRWCIVTMSVRPITSDVALGTSTLQGRLL